MRNLRFLNLLVVLVLLAFPITGIRPVSADHLPNASAASVVAWNTIAVDIIYPRQPPSVAAVTMAFVQAAVYDAVVTIEGGYQPYALKYPRRPHASVDAAVAQAAHDVLVNYFSTLSGDLDGKLAAALGPIPNGTAKAAGIEVGKAAAASLIYSRQNDGYMASVSFVPNGSGPGQWLPLSGQTALTPWLGKVKPLTMMSLSQFRPAPPPALTSQQYAADFNEVKEIGAQNSITRTAGQTDDSRFFAGHATPAYNSALKDIIQEEQFDAVSAARFLALAYLAAGDAGIACYDAKYIYQFWRPQVAIQSAESDGNPATGQDSEWLPLLGTPPHPEYISGHGCYTASVAEVMAYARGSRTINVTITTVATNVVSTTRYFNTADDLIERIIDVRVWSGIHFRNSDQQGVNVGTQVAHWVLDHYLLPTD